MPRFGQYNPLPLEIAYNPCIEAWVNRKPSWTGADILTQSGFDHRNFQPITPFSLLLTKGRTSDYPILRERNWHSHSTLSLRGTDCDIDRYIMVKMVRLILSVRTCRMERFDVCTFYRKRRKTWN